MPAVKEPYVVVATLFPEASSYGSTLLLNHGSLICDGLGGANIANELLHCSKY